MIESNIHCCDGILAGFLTKKNKIITFLPCVEIVFYVAESTTPFRAMIWLWKHKPKSLSSTRLSKFHDSSQILDHSNTLTPTEPIKNAVVSVKY